MNPFNQGNKVAITGTFGSGKSVFMLSLLHHLYHLDPQNFRLGDKRAPKPTHIKGIRSFNVKAAHQQFPYRTFAQRLMKPGGGTWPTRVHSLLRYKLSMKRSDQRRKDLLELFSFPLERFLDLPIARTERYTDWADRVLYLISEDSQASRQARQYLQHLDAPEIQPERLGRVYKKTLAQFIFDYKTFTSPSTFMIDLEGHRIDGGSPEIVSQGRYTGIPPTDGYTSREFIPLSGIARLRVPSFVEVQELHYNAYKERILTPIFKELNQCDTLVVLIDIPSLLSSGRGAFDEQVFLLEQLKQVLKSNIKGGQCMGKNQVRKVAIIANKCDLVRTFERDARLPHLLRQLTGPFIESLHKTVEVGRFLCSPCSSTRPDPDPERLIGRMVHAGRNPSKIERTFDVPEVPRFWPETYRPGDFPFTKVWPPALQAHEKLPRHHRLDDVCRFILS
jgi:uncharacterized protein